MTCLGQLLDTFFASCFALPLGYSAGYFTSPGGIRTRDKKYISVGLLRVSMVENKGYDPFAFTVQA